MHRNKNGSNKLPKHSFICNACVCYDSRTDEVLNKDKCKNCNGNGKEWQPRNADFSINLTPSSMVTFFKCEQ